MASEAMKTKWRIWYRSLDTNHDGVLSHKDAEFTKNQYATLHHFNAKKREEACKQFEEWFDKFILRNLKEGESMSEDDFVRMLDDEYKKDGKQGLLADMQAMVTKFLKAVDKDHIRDAMSEEDFRLICLAYGHTNIANDHQAFEDFNPVDGKITISDYYQIWTSFLTDDDESKDNPIRRIFDRDGYM